MHAIPCLVRVTNYKKDGTFFNQLLVLQPVHDSQAPVLPGQRSWVETYAHKSEF
ncbi:hypothetical protein T492DRAFT_893211 [Pavlovales sp. CCMP2436]|nr:hypothetical protein T492DRAFT_893211 [Pavlovales sp. CCMP2436]